MGKRIGILTAGGDGPGLNAALRGVGKAALGAFGMQLTGFLDGFSGMARRQYIELEGAALSNILTAGGTLLGTSRDRPNCVLENGKPVDRTEEVAAAYRELGLEALICLGGIDTQQSALLLQQRGLNVLTLPVTINNDLPQTETTIGFDTAMEIAAEAIDRLHTTASSHHRIIIVEMMGRHTGWLALGAGIAGGADVILIPEIPYEEQRIVGAILERSRVGKRFSIVAVAEGALSHETVQFFDQARQVNLRNRQGEQRQQVAARLEMIEKQTSGNTIHLANRLEKFTGLETRITILGYLQRGGGPSAVDRVLATQMGTAAALAVQEGRSGVMLATRGGRIELVPLEDASAGYKTVPLDHPWVQGARLVGTSLGD